MRRIETFKAYVRGEYDYSNQDKELMNGLIKKFGKKEKNYDK